jgi:hypothetical protein
MMAEPRPVASPATVGRTQAGLADNAQKSPATSPPPLPAKK